MSSVFVRVLQVHDLPPFQFWVYTVNILEFLCMFKLYISIETGLYVA